MNRRAERQEAIRQMVRSHRVRTQNEIAASLKTRGFDCTQATVSRDIADMDLLKSAEGFYQLPEDRKLSQMVSGLVEDVSCSGNTVVVRTSPGSAPGVAGAIDAASLDQVLGTVAGDDTIFVVAASPASAADVDGLIKGLVMRR